MNWVFVLLFLVLLTDMILKKFRSAEKGLAGFYGITALVGIVGCMMVRGRLADALLVMEQEKEYIDDSFVQWALTEFDRFAPMLLVLCLLVAAVMLWNGIFRGGKKQLVLWIFFGAILQLFTLWRGICTINAYFDLAIWMNHLFCFAVLALHLVEVILSSYRNRLKEAYPPSRG